MKGSGDSWIRVCETGFFNGLSGIGKDVDVILSSSQIKRRELHQNHRGAGSQGDLGKGVQFLQEKYKELDDHR